MSDKKKMTAEEYHRRNSPIGSSSRSSKERGALAEALEAGRARFAGFNLDTEPSLCGRQQPASGRGGRGPRLLRYSLGNLSAN